jgi:putative cell wall-binding protein
MQGLRSRLAVALLIVVFGIPVLPASPVVASAHSAVDDAYAVDEDGVLSVVAPGVLADDLPEPAGLTAEFVTGPANAASFTLNADGSFDYTPTADFNGEDSFTYRALDALSDPSNVATVTITVNPVNDAPSFTKGGDQGVLEDAGPQTVPAWATAISAGPPDESSQVLAFAVSSNTNAGLFSAGPSVAADGTLTYTPAANANGAATVGILLTDDGGTSAGGVDTSAEQTFTITVGAVNDPPTFVSGGDVAVAEDSGPYDAPWAASISAGPFDELSQAVTFGVTNDANGLFAVQPAIDGDGRLTFTPAADANGAAEVTVTASDDGGTANGGDDTADPVTFTITIGGVNDPPVADDTSASTDEDQPVVGVTLTATDVDGDGLAIAVVSGPTNGSLTFEPGFCAAGACTREVTYTPDPDFNGMDSFTFAATEVLTDPALTSNTATVTITVNPVNDPPSFTKGGDQVVLEDAGSQSVAGWATLVNVGPADESDQALAEYLVSSNSNPGLFSVAPAVAIDGTLTYTPAANANGSATIGVRARDDGGTDLGGVDTSAEQTFTITVTAVNDVPSFAKGADDSVAEDSGARSVPGWATAISPGPANEAGQAVTFEIASNSNAALFATGPTVSATGTLSYTPAANRNGVATIQVRITDNGGAANGGANASASRSFMISVTSVNDPPNAVNDVSFTVAANSGPTALDVLANDSIAPDTGESLTIVAATQGAHGSVAITGGGSGLAYQPNAFFEGADIFTYTISDGALTDTATVLVTVVPAGGVGRLAGPDRYATAAAISAATFAPGVPIAYVATGSNFPDALAGAAAGGFRGGPVLLVTQFTIPQATLTELARLQPFKIVVLGSAGVVGDAVANALVPYTTSGVVERYAGPDRYATAAAISAATFVVGPAVAYVATGANFPDALAGAAAGGFLGGPVLLVTQFTIPQATLTELARLQPFKIVVLGSSGVVGDAVANALVPYTTSGVVERLAGPDRYATAAAISAATFAPGVPVAYIATGTNFPDALAGAAAGGHRSGPVLLVNPAVAALPGPTAAELARLKPRTIIVLGSAGAVPDSILNLLPPYVVAP